MASARQGNNWLRNFIPYLLYRITNQLTRRLRSRLRHSGINITRWRVLSVLKAHRTLTLSEIVQLTVMEQPSVSRVVAQLEQEGLVRRRTSKNDSRCVNIDLTRAGNSAFEAIHPTADAHQKAALAGFSRAEIAALKSYLRRIQKNIDAEF